MPFVLIILFTTYMHTPGAGAMQEFSSKETCEAARAFVMSAGRTEIAAAACVQK